MKKRKLIGVITTDPENIYQTTVMKGIFAGVIADLGRGQLDRTDTAEDIREYRHRILVLAAVLAVGKHVIAVADQHQQVAAVCVAHQHLADQVEAACRNLLTPDHGLSGFSPIGSIQIPGFHISILL